MTEDNIAVHTLKANAFPFTLRWFNQRGEYVGEPITVDGPGVMNVPPVAKEIGETVGVHTTFPDGVIVSPHDDWTTWINPLTGKEMTV